jgi:maestro heat-like repeat-containing protein family member 1
MELQKIKSKIITDDSKEIYDLANALAKIIAGRLSSLQHVQFTKQLLCSVDDAEQSSAIGASVVLKFFIQLKGGDMFHAIPELMKDCLAKLKHCEIQYARSGILKALVALTKHHPKIMCNEMLAQPLPFEA